MRGYLSETRQNLVRDLGPLESDLTQAQVILIDRVITKLGILRVIEEHVRETGVMKNGLVDLSLGTHYLAFTNSLRLELQALGINQRKGDKILDLGRYKETKMQEKAARANGAGPAQEPAGPGKDEGAGREIVAVRPSPSDFPAEDRKGEQL